MSLKSNRFKNKANAASFCVSLSSEADMLKSFNPELWPAGTVVRPFRPSRSGSSMNGQRQKQRQRGSYVGRWNNQQRHNQSTYRFNQRTSHFDHQSHQGKFNQSWQVRSTAWNRPSQSGYEYDYDNVYGCYEHDDYRM